MSDAKFEFDVIVVGGGLMGVSAAFHLTREHRMRVLVIERGLVGAQASGVNFGHVRRQGRFLPQIPLANRSREIWGNLTRLVGQDCEFLASGSLKLAFDENAMRQLVDYAQEARQYGLDLCVLGRDTLRQRYPWLSPKVCGGTLQPEDGHANPRLVAPAFGRAAAAAGATIREFCEVNWVTRANGVFEVSTTAFAPTAGGTQAPRHEKFRAPLILNAAGAWANRIAALFGEHAPMQVKGPLMGVSEPLPYFVGPVLGSVGGDVYMRQVKRGNLVWGGGRWSTPQVDPARARPIPEHLPVQLADIRQLIPSLSSFQVIRTWSGVEGYTPDVLPVLGPSMTTPGLFHAYGFSGSGFQLGPAVGAVVAEWLAIGASPTPIDEFSIARFTRTPRSHADSSSAGADQVDHS